LQSESAPELSYCSEECLDLIKSWIKTCNLNHCCNSPASSSSNEYPTRLIDVGTESAPALRICEGKTIPSSSRYLTLSHCWGKDKFYVLELGNLEELKQSIPKDKLTKTHREAIHLTRRLGFRYIWIDSLCIIQNSLQDWDYESSRMIYVYSNSYCNIAATGAADGSRGLFFPRDSDDLDPVVIKIPGTGPAMPGSQRSLISIGLVRTLFQYMSIVTEGQEIQPGHFERFYFTDADVWSNGVSRSPLGKRAWCLQERFLSPRTIHFGEKELLFECQELFACSRFPEGIPPNLIPVQENKELVSLRNAARQAGQIHSSAMEHAHQMWQHLVTTYSTCELTYGKDKLVAISGMASFIERNLHLSDYYAGLWKYKILDQLLWSILEDEETPFNRPYQRPTEYQAPTWSWASLNHAIKFPIIAKTRDKLANSRRPRLN
jgi:hypothetical protein